MRGGRRGGKEPGRVGPDGKAAALLHAAPNGSEDGDLTHLTFFYVFEELRFNGFKTRASAERAGIYVRQFSDKQGVSKECKSELPSDRKNDEPTAAREWPGF